MHPAMSLCLLTVLAGAGQGIFILLAALNSFFHDTGAIPPEYVLTAGIISLGLQIVGIITSTSHLGNPQRGWRAMLMIKNSWLSREVITISFSVGAGTAYIALYYFGISGIPLLGAGLIGTTAAIGFFISSSMLYASVKFIREWSNVYTPLNFLLFGITSGFGVSLAVLNYAKAELFIIDGVSKLVIILSLLSLIMKALTYKFNKNAYVSVNIKNAVGVNDPDIKLMDMGTSYDHYNTKEYFHPISNRNNTNAKTLILTMAFVLPIIIWITTTLNPLWNYAALLNMTAAISMIVGLVMERRLFFIQGNNIQNLYYANFKNAGARNPIVSKARRGTPVAP